MLVARLEAAIPGVRCVISTTTQTGMEIALKRFENHTVFYFPLDFSWAVKNALKRIQPTAVVLAELEVWPNFTYYARRAGVKILVANGRISDKSFPAYRRGKWILQSAFRRIDAVISQSESVSQRFIELGVEANRVHTVGSIKFDGAKTDRNSPAVTAVKNLTGRNADGFYWSGLNDNEIVFLAGSTQEPEEEMALDVFESLQSAFPTLRLILVPRHPERFEDVAQMLAKRQVPFIRRTELNGADSFSEKDSGLPQAKILLVNAMGELGAWWGTAQIAFVGGSMGSRGGQNMLEPAAYGAAVSFGPNTGNFRDIVAILLQSSAAKVVHNTEELREFVQTLLTQAELREEMGNRARNVVLSQQGAADKTIEIIRQAIE